MRMWDDLMLPEPVEGLHIAKNIRSLSLSKGLLDEKKLDSEIRRNKIRS